jgi:hypothetical protein
VNGDNMSKEIEIKRKDAVTKGRKVYGSKGVSKIKATITGKRVVISKNATGHEILNTLKIGKASKKAGRSAASKSKKKTR